jgi:hypothetical protein
MCQHQPWCQGWPTLDRLAARIVADQPGQGWSLLCNGVIVFDNGGELLPMAVPSLRAASSVRPGGLGRLSGSAVSQMSPVKHRSAEENHAYPREFLWRGSRNSPRRSRRPGSTSPPRPGTPGTGRHAHERHGPANADPARRGRPLKADHCVRRPGSGRSVSPGSSSCRDPRGTFQRLGRAKAVAGAARSWPG